MKNKSLFIILVSFIVSLTALTPNVVHAEGGEGIYIKTDGETVSREYDGIESVNGPGLNIYAMEDSDVTVTVNGEVSSLGDNGWDAIDVYSSDSNVNVSVGSVIGKYDGVYVGAYDGNFNLEAGNITGGQNAINVIADGKSSVIINSGDLTIENGDFTSNGIVTYSNNDSYVEINAGDISANDDGIDWRQEIICSLAKSKGTSGSCTVLDRNTCRTNKCIEWRVCITIFVCHTPGIVITHPYKAEMISVLMILE